FFPPPSTLTHTLAYVTATTAIYTLSLHDALPISPNQAFFQLPSTFFQRSVDWIDFTFFFQLQVTLNSARIISFSTPTKTQPSIINMQFTHLFTLLVLTISVSAQAALTPNDAAPTSLLSRSTKTTTTLKLTYCLKNEKFCKTRTTGHITNSQRKKKEL